MCGIAGKVSPTGRQPVASRELLARMAQALRHRGPEAFGVYRDARAGLVHARLSLVDLATGQQPMRAPEGTRWIVFNGEIYNYVELREQLEAKGRRFATHSDTEVIVQAYAEWGTECFRRFNGQWALALWDATTNELVLSRDPIGICPLHVREHDGVVWFASEAKALFADPEVPRAIDPAGLAQTFTSWAPIAPVTAFAGIGELPPGSFRVYAADGSRRDGMHWQPAYPPTVPTTRLSLADATNELRDALLRATQLRITRADVPVGSYLSGGLDSSLIAWLGRRAHRGRFRTYSVRFADRGFDETHYQRAMAATLESEHEELLVTRADIAAVFPAVVRYTERPIMRTAPAPLYLLSAAVQQSNIKAVLTGEGADEMLGGYDVFREAKIRRFWARRPDSTARPRLFDRIYPYLALADSQTRNMSQAFWKRGLDRVDEPGFSHDPRWNSARALQRFFAADVKAALADAPAPDPLDSLPDAFASWSPLAQAQYLEITTLLSPYIISSQSDRMSLAHSVEGRYPFLDADVIALCNSLPPDYELASLDEKHILKRVADGLIPDEIIRRKKQPYRAPEAVCFTAPDAPDYVADVLSERAVAEAGMFEPRLVAALHQKCRQRSAGGEDTLANADNMAFVGIMSAQLLHHELIAGNRPVDACTFTTDVDTVSGHHGF